MNPKDLLQDTRYLKKVKLYRLVQAEKRNLGPVLDANGWAINARARINIPFGTSLTQLARLPKARVALWSTPTRKKERCGLFHADCRSHYRVDHLPFLRRISEE